MPRLLASIKEEFRCANFKFNGTTRDDFEQPVWKYLHGMKYVVIRWIAALYFITAICISLAKTATTGWIFALTSVNYIIVTIYFLFSAISATYYAWMTSRKQSIISNKQTTSQDQLKLPKDARINTFIKFHWFWHNLSMISCTFIVVSFWIMIAPSREGGYPPSMRTYLVIDRHGINFFVLIVDFFLNKIPFRILHFVYPSVFIGLYFVYNAIYWSITKKLVYGEMLNYGTRPGMITGLAFGAVFFICPLIQLFWYLAYILKRKFLIKQKEDHNDNCEMHNLDNPQCEV